MRVEAWSKWLDKTSSDYHCQVALSYELTWEEKEYEAGTNKQGVSKKRTVVVLPLVLRYNTIHVRRLQEEY